MLLLFLCVARRAYVLVQRQSVDEVEQAYAVVDFGRRRVRQLRRHVEQAVMGMGMMMVPRHRARRYAATAHTLLMVMVVMTQKRSEASAFSVAHQDCRCGGRY